MLYKKKTFVPFTNHTNSAASDLFCSVSDFVFGGFSSPAASSCLAFSPSPMHGEMLLHRRSATGVGGTSQTDDVVADVAVDDSADGDVGSEYLGDGRSAMEMGGD